MDWPLVIFSLSVMLFGYRGFRKGFLRSTSRLLALVSGYLAAIFYSQPLARILESATSLEGLAAILCASLILFSIGALAIAIVFQLIGKLMPKRPDASRVSAAGGALVGAFSGVIVGIVAVWIFGFVEDMIAPESSRKSENRTQGLVSRATSVATRSALSLADAGPEITRLGSAFMATPGEIALQAKRLTESNDLGNLLGDPANQQIISRGDIEAVKALPAFRQLAANPDLQALMKTSGMLTANDSDSAAAETLLAEKIVDIWRRMERVKNNRRVQEILEDAEFQRKIQSGNPLDFLTNAQLLELANILFDENTKNRPVSADQTETSREPTAIYRWVDESGKVHYSDKSPD